MKKIALAVFLIWHTFTFAQLSDASSILKAHFDAISQAKLSQVKSLSVQGKFIQNTTQLNLSIHKKRNNKWMQSLSFNGQKKTMAVNSTKGWEIDQFSGSATPVEYSLSTLSQLKENTSIDSYLWLLHQAGNSIDYIGMEEVDDRALYHLIAMDENNMKVDFYIDIKTNLLYKTSNPYTEQHAIIKEYMTQSDITFPKVIEVHRNELLYHTVYDTIIIDPELEDSMFTKPNILSTEQIAEKYLKAFYDMNYKSLKEYYTDSSVWHDPSSSTIWPNTTKSIGKDKIILDLSTGFTGVLEANYEINEAFYTGPYASIWGSYKYKIPAKYFQALQGSDKILEFSIKMNTNLLIKDGKVLEHIEHGDWSSWLKQVQSYINQINKN